ncbi:MAG: anti-sigma factor antagonist [Lachnospirales bacterium]
MIEILEETLVVRINKDIDHHNAQIIRENVEKIYKDKNLKNIIFDFSKVHFMDSSGIGMCIGRFKLVRAMNGKFIACGLTYEVERIFDMAGLSKIITICDDVKSSMTYINL